MIVLLGVFEELVRLSRITSSGTGENMRILRIFRVQRAIGVMQVLRWSQDFQKMLTGILDSIWSLFWVVVCLLVIFFIAAVLVAMAIAHYHEDVPVDKVSPELRDRFGSMLGTMYSMHCAAWG